MHESIFLYAYLIPAMEQDGCPICNVQRALEDRFLLNLNHEFINDVEMRIKFIASLGFCPKHMWRLAALEIEEDASTLGNSILYEDLLDVVLHTLQTYQKRNFKYERKILGWLDPIISIFTRKTGIQPGDPFERQKIQKCYVCQSGANQSKFYLEQMVEDFCNADSLLRKKYSASDGLCLTHLKTVLKYASPSRQKGVEFVRGESLAKLTRLYHQLQQFKDNDGALQRDELIIKKKQLIRYIAGNETSIFPPFCQKT